MRRKGTIKASLRAAVAALPVLAFAAGAAAQEWPSYGGDPGGQRFSGATQITPFNVGRLAPAWIFHTGERRPPGPKDSSFEDTPILAEGRLLVCTPTDRVAALDPLTGHAIWAFDPKLSPGLRPASDFLCRGVAVWRDAAAGTGTDCRTRVVLATLDLRVIELDLATGRPCAGFGERGTVRVAPARPPRYPGAVAFDSPPAVVGDTLVVGSALDDMTEARPSGSAVRGLDARSGALRWRFGGHVAAVPAQGDKAWLRRDIVVATKTGFVFVLDRDTGHPLFPVTERPVPASDVSGEAASPTQPVPSAPPPLVPQRLAPDDAWGVAFVDRWLCRRQIERLRSDGLYTPPSLRGTIIYPFTGGGVNWGGGAFDQKDDLYIVNTVNVAHVVRLIPHAEYPAARAAAPGAEIGPELGTPYAAERTLLFSIFGVPCNPPPWSTLAAIDLATGTIRWQVPLGSMAFGLIRGLPNLGGPIVTASGLVFIAAARDNKLLAFDVHTGRELWQAPLPAGGQATPMTYVAGGRQFVVIAAGGHARMGTRFGDAVVAFTLPAASAGS